MRPLPSIMTLVGSISWRPLEQRAAQGVAPAGHEAVPEPPAEFDEDGRRYAFRFPQRRPAAATIDRDRLFEFVRLRRRSVDGHWTPFLPDASVRSYVRDRKNSADFFTDVRDLQTHADVLPIDSQTRRLRAV